MTGKCWRKIIGQLFLIFCILKKNKYPQLTSQKLIRILKNIILLMIPNEEKEEWYYLAVKKLPALLRGRTKHHCDFSCFNRLHSFRTENKLNLM